MSPQKRCVLLQEIVHYGRRKDGFREKVKDLHRRSLVYADVAASQFEKTEGADDWGQIAWV